MNMKNHPRASKKKKITLRNTSSAVIAGCLFFVLLIAVLCVLLAPKIAKNVREKQPDLTWLGIDNQNVENLPSPSPTATPDPAEAHSLYQADLTAVQKEILLNEYAYLADVRWNGKDLWCAVGPYSSATGIASFNAGACIHPDAGTKEYYKPELKHNMMRYPIGNDTWMVYADVMNSGGGRIAAMNLETGEVRELKTVHIGIPEPWIWKDKVFWTERTGTDRYKLFGCDIVTGESVTIAILEGGAAQSKICLYGNELLYVNSREELISLNLITSESKVLAKDQTIHDPQTNGVYTAYMTGYHDYGSELVYWGKDGIRHVAANSVVTFSLGDNFIAYGDLDKTYVFFPEDGLTYCVTRPGEKALFETAGGDLVYWLDTDWHDKDVLECMHINDL